MLTIVTGNLNKFKDLEAALAPTPVAHVEMDLDEIQELNPELVIEHKLKQAHAKNVGIEFLIDDRSLSVEGLGGLPGTFVKWFLETVGAEGIYSMAKNSKSMRAEARAWVGYASESGELHFFEGVVPGTIVEPRGNLDYGWGPIFLPDGSSKTFGEMDKAEKAKWSHYGKALEKFKEYYETKRRAE